MRRVVIFTAAVIIWFALGGVKPPQKGQAVGGRPGTARRDGGEPQAEGSPNEGASYLSEPTANEPVSLKAYRLRRVAALRAGDDRGAKAGVPFQRQDDFLEVRQVIAERVRRTIKRRRMAA